MVNTTTVQTSALQTTAIAGKHAINRYFNKNCIFAPPILRSNGTPTNNFGPMGERKPKMYDLSQWYGKNLQKGQTISIPVEAQRFYGQNKQEGVPVEFQASTFTNVDFTVAVNTAVAVRIEKYQKHYNNVEDYDSIIKDAMMEALVQEIEERTFALFPSITESVGAGAGAAFSRSSLRTVQRTFDLKNVPGHLNRFAVVTPYAYGAVADEIDEFQLAGPAGAESIKTGMTAYKKLNNINLLQSNHINVVGGASKMAAFCDDSFMFAMAYSPRFENDFNLSHLADEMVIDMIFAVGIKRQDTAILLDFDDTNNI